MARFLQNILRIVARFAEISMWQHWLTPFWRQ